jgi:hypothetical protein
MSEEEDSDTNTQRFRQYYKYTPKIDNDWKKKYNFYKKKHILNKNSHYSRSREKSSFENENK